MLYNVGMKMGAESAIGEFFYDDGIAVDGEATVDEIGELVMLNRGRVLESGCVRDFFYADRHFEVFLFSWSGLRI